MADAVCILGAFVHDELAVFPLCERRQQLDRVVLGAVMKRASILRGLFERLVGVAGNDLGTSLFAEPSD
jgi:hypothetical protein